jgi:hypothetical protein
VFIYLAFVHVAFILVAFILVAFILVAFILLAFILLAFILLAFILLAFILVEFILVASRFRCGRLAGGMDGRVAARSRGGFASRDAGNAGDAIATSKRWAGAVCRCGSRR